MKGIIYRIKDVVTGKLKLPVTIDKAIQVSDTTHNLYDITKNIELDWTKTYYGRPLNIRQNTFGSSVIGLLSPTNATKQSFAVNDDYFITVVGYTTNSTTLWLYNRHTWQRLAIITLPQYYHGNTMKFSSKKPSDSNIPYLYIDQWDSDRKLAIVKINNSYQATIVKTIIIHSTMDENLFGSGMTDWAIDEENGLMYSLTYKKSGSTSYADTNNNGLYICQFLLPDITDTTTVALTTAEIIKNWKRDCIYYRQHCELKNGLMFILAGLTYSGTPVLQEPKMFVLDSEMNLYCSIDMKQVSNYEPEGMSIQSDGTILYTTREQSEIFLLDFNSIKI